ncbi:MAG TPA: glutamine-hydrolyzing GMP synthase [Acidiphilium sp.]|jgi:GMP synthase (glutamine-hydrolysing)|uniref:glutamine-hydrolyzing GMP synthase n=1 Tax=unclassified Acidiphilium TaxID=2617493 RepID=UPI000BCE2427|nr:MULTISPECIES: glutamine-hydrolyzing GMP synthase [unclassified Acidiphilium]OYV57488.1 MAG: GMP synthase (glutamine-hydrolyzing) [Acidiphilium sp. 20-67-58]HQT59639.1 glutamine-hydrolyzing GMP synthase [Acidiphilium sp.]HQU10321.1 glutamine-hydrolyzing GMP synthase [Acidiphilium sp.]
MSDAPSADRILILDFGSQVTQLIARRLRETGVYCEIWPFDADPSRMAAFAPKGIILSGGPASVIEAVAPKPPAGVFGAGVPVLGICYGEQAICDALGGAVEGSDHREFGRAFIDVTEDCALFEGVWTKGQRAQVWMSHGDRVTALPPGFRAVAVSEGAPFAAIADDTRRIYGVQFHPEVVHTPDGARLLANFAHKVCGLAGGWTMANFRETARDAIRVQVGTGRVICGLSGGVDSSVAAALIHEAIGDQLVCIFVDHGLLRAGEADEVVRVFRDRFNIRLVHRDASDLFFAALEGVTDPEVKRKTIGRLFIEVFEEEAQKLGGADFLAQGTLYPDVIESVSARGGPSAVIKSHHNVGGLPDRMRMKLVEPLRELFKDEVRDLGRELGLPETIVGRHPFPGPGLAIRIPGPVDREKVRILQKADAIYLEEIRNAGLYDAIWQAFVALLPVRSVGVMGDGRTYDFACALRAVTSTDGMTADVYPFDMSFLTRVAGRIVNEVRGINRVTYDITSKPPGTIEWE